MESGQTKWAHMATQRQVEDLLKEIGTAVLVYRDFWNVRFKNQLAKSTLMRLLEIDVKETEDFPTASQS